MSNFYTDDTQLDLSVKLDSGQIFKNFFSNPVETEIYNAYKK